MEFKIILTKYVYVERNYYLFKDQNPIFGSVRNSNMCLSSHYDLVPKFQLLILCSINLPNQLAWSCMKGFWRKQALAILLSIELYIYYCYHSLGWFLCLFY